MTCISSPDIHSISGSALPENVVPEEAATPISTLEALLAALNVTLSDLSEEEFVPPMGPPPGLEHIVLPSRQTLAGIEQDDDMPLPPGIELAKQIDETDVHDLRIDNTTDEGPSSSDSSSEDESPGSEPETLSVLTKAPWRIHKEADRAGKALDAASKVQPRPPWRRPVSDSVSKPNEAAPDLVKAQAPWRVQKKQEKVPLKFDPLEFPAEQAEWLDSDEEVLWVSSRRQR